MHLPLALWGKREGRREEEAATAAAAALYARTYMMTMHGSTAYNSRCWSVKRLWGPSSPPSQVRTTQAMYRHHGRLFVQAPRCSYLPSSRAVISCHLLLPVSSASSRPGYRRREQRCSGCMTVEEERRLCRLPHRPVTVTPAGHVDRRCHRMVRGA